MMKIYKAMIITCGVALAGQCVRYAAYALTPAPTVYPQSLEMVAVEARDSGLMSALLGMPEPDTRGHIDARQPLVAPVGIPPLPVVKPEVK